MLHVHRHHPPPIRRLPTALLADCLPRLLRRDCRCDHRIHHCQVSEPQLTVLTSKSSFFIISPFPPALCFSLASHCSQSPLPNTPGLSAPSSTVHSNSALPSVRQLSRPSRPASKRRTVGPAATRAVRRASGSSPPVWSSRLSR